MNLPTLPIFTHIHKDEATHTYTTADGQQLANVSGIVKSLEKPFDSDYWAQVNASKRGTTAEVVKAEWEAAQTLALHRGIRFHDFACRTLQGETLAAATPEMAAFVKWYFAQSESGLKVVTAEWVIGDSTLGIAGTIDALFMNEEGDLMVYDWKSGKKFYTYSRYPLLYPFDDIPNCEFHRYSLQVSLYRLILRRAGLPHVRLGKLVHFAPNGEFEVYTALDYADRLEAWLSRQAVHPTR
jgi:hypothetical protein